jgi:hypothetical protein
LICEQESNRSAYHHIRRHFYLSIFWIKKENPDIKGTTELRRQETSVTKMKKKKENLQNGGVTQKDTTLESVSKKLSPQ